MNKEGKKKKSSGSSGGKRSQRQLLKVVYISSPMKVQATASEFRSVVQQLTGQDSDVATFMDHQLQNDHEHDEISDNSSAPTVSNISHDHERPAINTVDSGSYYSLLHYNQNHRLTLISDDDHNDNFLLHLDNMLSGERRSFQEGGYPFGFHHSSFLDVFN